MRRAAVVTIGMVLLLAGCSSPAPQPTATVSAPPSTSSPAPTATASPSTTATATEGCRDRTAAVPDDAVTASIGDVDGDGRDDTEFVALPSKGSPHPLFGITTAAGGVFAVSDGLAGPGGHGAWVAVRDAFPRVLAVTDDGRQGNLFTFVDCRIQEVTNPQGQQFRFGLNGYSEYGTGVACDDRSGDLRLEGAQAMQRSGGRVDVRWTRIDIDRDLVAQGTTTEVRYRGLAADDARVEQAKENRCGDVPVVRTSAD